MPQFLSDVVLARSADSAKEAVALEQLQVSVEVAPGGPVAGAKPVDMVWADTSSVTVGPDGLRRARVYAQDKAGEVFSTPRELPAILSATPPTAGPDGQPLVAGQEWVDISVPVAGVQVGQVTLVDSPGILVTATLNGPVPGIPRILYTPPCDGVLMLSGAIQYRPTTVGTTASLQSYLIGTGTGFVTGTTDRALGTAASTAGGTIHPQSVFQLQGQIPMEVSLHAWVSSSVTFTLDFTSVTLVFYPYAKYMYLSVSPVL